MSDAVTPAPSTLMIDSAGQLVPTAPAELADKQALGWVPASPEQIADFELQAKYSTPGQTLATGAESAARALTFGLSTAVERKAGVPAEDIAARERVNPLASAVGTGAGLLAPLALGGAGAFTAPGAISKAGAGLTEAVGAALPKAATKLGSMATHGAAHAAGWAAEGALYGAGNVVHEAALGDPNLTAESAMAEIGLSGLLGGAIGGAMGARAGATPAALSAARDAVAGMYGGAKEGIAAGYRAMAGATGTAAATADVMVQNAITIGALERAAPGVAKAMEASTPEMAQFLVGNAAKLAEKEATFPGLTKMLANGRDVPSAANILDNFDSLWRDTATRTKAARSMADGMSEVLDKTNAMMKQAHGGIIPEEAAALLTREGGANLPLVAQKFGETFDSIAAAAAKMRAEPELFSQPRARHLEKLAEGLARDVGDMSNPVQVFDRLNVLKRTLDDVIPYGQEALSQSFADKQAINLIKGLRSDVKNLITDGSVFGEAAARRAALNEAQAEWLQLTGPGGDFRKLFMERSADGARLSSNKVDTHLGQILRLRGEDGIRAWDEVVQAARKLTDEVERSAASTGAAFDKDAMAALVNRSAEETAATRQAASVTRALREQNPAIPFGNGIAVPLQQAQSVLGGIPGVTQIVSTIKAATSVSATASVLARLEELGQRVSDKIDAQVSTLVRGGIKGESVGRGEVAAGIAHIHGMQAADRVVAYERRKRQVEDLTADPETFSQRLDEHTSPLTPHAPNTASAMQVAGARAAQFLASKIPHGPPALGPLPPEWHPSQSEIATYLRYHEAVTHPLGILKQAAAGTLTPEAVEAVRVVYPQLYGQIQSAITEQLAGQRKRPSYQSILGMSMLLGYSLDGSTTPGAVQRAQASFAKPAAPPQGRSGATPARADSLKIANRYQTPSQDSAARSQ